MINGEKIYLRPILLEDLEVLNKWKNDKDIFKNLGGGFKPISIDEHRNYMEGLINNSGNNKRFLILTKSGEKIGFIGLYDIDNINKNCSLGIYIGNKSCWGKGFASESCNVISDYAKNYLNLNKIKLLVTENNIAAIGLYKKLNFIKCGVYINDRYIDGKYENVVIMEKCLLETKK